MVSLDEEEEDLMEDKRKYEAQRDTLNETQKGVSYQ